MIRNLTAIFLFVLTFTACGQSGNTKTVNGLTIDPNIKSEAEKHIEVSKELDVFKDKMQVYLNSGIIQSYQNDSLVFSSANEDNKSPFKSFYFWNGDTLTIDGAFGIFGGIGFAVNIYKNNAVLYHMLSSDEWPTYAYREKDSLIFRLEVPCTDTKIILSEIPDSTKKQIIYGYVEFKSSSFFVSRGIEDGKEVLPRQKVRNNMKLYFKSGKLDL